MPVRSARFAFTFSIEGIRRPTRDVPSALFGFMPRKRLSNSLQIMFHKIDYSWATLTLLGRAMHCNVGRPALWVFPPAA